MSVRDVLAMVLCLSLGGCAWISNDEYLSSWDKDGDGWGVADDESADPSTFDCDDDDASVFPYAEDVRGDGVDADCGMEPDADGDDWPDAVDCDDSDPDIYPCSPTESENDDVDSDCDGLTTRRTDDCNTADPDYEG